MCTVVGSDISVEYCNTRLLYSLLIWYIIKEAILLCVVCVLLPMVMYMFLWWHNCINSLTFFIFGGFKCIYWPLIDRALPIHLQAKLLSWLNSNVVPKLIIGLPQLKQNVDHAPLNLSSDSPHSGLTTCWGLESNDTTSKEACILLVIICNKY